MQTSPHGNSGALRCASFALALAALALPAMAQDAARVLVVETNAPGATVYAESVGTDALAELGRADLPLALPGDVTAVRIVALGGDGWSVEPVRVALAPGGGDTLRVEARFPYLYRVETVPYGASVFAGERALALGTTPVTLRFENPLEAPLHVTLEGYRPRVIAVPGEALWNRHVLSLEATQLGSEGAGDGITTIGLDPPRRRLWIDALALTTAVAGGAVAIHYKFKADRRHEAYMVGGAREGDPELRREFERYDTLSAVGLGAMQVGVGVFAVRLILR